MFHRGYKLYRFHVCPRGPLQRTSEQASQYDSGNDTGTCIIWRFLLLQQHLLLINMNLQSCALLNLCLLLVCCCWRLLLNPPPQPSSSTLLLLHNPPPQPSSSTLLHTPPHPKWSHVELASAAASFFEGQLRSGSTSNRRERDREHEQHGGRGKNNK